MSVLLTLGIVIVLMIVLEARFHRRRVLALCLPRDGFKIVIGTTKSEVRIRFLFQSTLSPWGLNCSPRILRVPATSWGCSAMILKFASVSTRRPGEVPTAARED